ncbi:hypothetical protein BGZ61DRAFT_221741 [Ilyonectria robusta]|uniref:uncharacterized protein n=1 Tax=Ilyonectria robusta TaxID=1079257 RepID=UPI001E8E67A0|nr:uncharacterized protein BGZ61DRAFT_221741 [Ilyonectria robusta]KAH8706492.1 hypothetical protein BGZ61DRAFT_221741 [Ilyonectria robusta]
MLEILVGAWRLAFPVSRPGFIRYLPASACSTLVLLCTIPYFVCERTAACIVTRPERTHVFECHSVPHHRDYSDRTASHWPPGSPYPGLLYLRCIAIFITPTTTSLLLLHQPNRLTTTSVPPCHRRLLSTRVELSSTWFTQQAPQGESAEHSPTFPQPALQRAAHPQPHSFWDPVCGRIKRAQDRPNTRHPDARTPSCARIASSWPFPQFSFYDIRLRAHSRLLTPSPTSLLDLSRS